MFLYPIRSIATSEAMQLCQRPADALWVALKLVRWIAFAVG